MPDLSGKTKRQALGMLAPLQVGIEMSGQGSVVRQDPPAGTELDPSAVVRVTLASPMLAAAAPVRPVIAMRRPPRPTDSRSTETRAAESRPTGLADVKSAEPTKATDTEVGGDGDR
jgi:hypothetical protein